MFCRGWACLLLRLHRLRRSAALRSLRPDSLCLWLRLRFGLFHLLWSPRITYTLCLDTFSLLLLMQRTLSCLFSGSLCVTLLALKLARLALCILIAPRGFPRQCIDLLLPARICLSCSSVSLVLNLELGILDFLNP